MGQSPFLWEFLSLESQKNTLLVCTGPKDMWNSQVIRRTKEGYAVWYFGGFQNA